MPGPLKPATRSTGGGRGALWPSNIRSIHSSATRTSLAVVHTHECRGCVYRSSQGVSALFVRSRGFSYSSWEQSWGRASKMSLSRAHQHVRDKGAAYCPPRSWSSSSLPSKWAPGPVCQLRSLRKLNLTTLGGAGVLAGVGGAIARDTNPFASGVLSGVQWFTLGTSYWCMCQLLSAR